MHHFGPSHTPFFAMSVVVAVLGSWTALDLFLVLVVDDDDDVRVYVEAVLREAGYTVIAVTGPAEAIDRLRSGLNPDYVVIDYAMPDLTGEQTYQQLRSAGFAGKALFITGYSDVEALKGAEVLRKPFEPEELLVRIAALSGEAATTEA